MLTLYAAGRTRNRFIPGSMILLRAHHRAEIESFRAAVAQCLASVLTTGYGIWCSRREAAARGRHDGADRSAPWPTRRRCTKPSRRCVRVPVGKASLVMIVVPLAIPLVLTAALQIPLKDVLLNRVKTMM